MSAPAGPFLAVAHDPIDEDHPLQFPPLDTIRRAWSKRPDTLEADAARGAVGGPTPPPVAVTDPYLIPAATGGIFADVLPGTGPGGSIAAVLQERLRQIERFGHTAEADMDRPLLEFLRNLSSQVNAARDDHHFRPSDFAQLRQRVARVGAMALATIDRIDAQLREDEQLAKDLFA